MGCSTRSPTAARASRSSRRFSDARWHAPWQPILVSPIGVGAFLSEYGLRVLQNEMLWLWLPSMLVALTARLARRRASRTRAIAA